MKLIELLVKELPKRGGFPKGATQVVQDDCGKVKFFDSDCLDYDRYWSGSPKGSYYWTPDHSFIMQLSSDNRTTIVTRKEYEAATTWDGTEIPSVGCLVEVSLGTFGWLEAEVSAVTECFLVAKCVDKNKHGLEIVIYHTRIDAYTGQRTRQDLTLIRPILTKEERQRKEIIEAMRKSCTNYNRTDVIHAIEELYDSIAEDRIPGVQLTQ